MWVKFVIALLVVIFSVVDSYSFSNPSLEVDKYLIRSGEYNYTSLFDDNMSVYLVMETFFFTQKDDLFSLDDLKLKEVKKIDLSSILQVRFTESNGTREDVKKQLSCTETYVVYFPFGRYLLTKDQKESLKRFLNYLGSKDNNYRNRRYVVTGWGCYLGGEKINKKLSKMRALEVAKFLKYHGITDIVLSGKGISRDSDVLCLNRKVEIKVLGIPCDFVANSSQIAK